VGFNLEGLVLDLQGFFDRLNLMVLRLKPLLQHGKFSAATLERENHFGDRFIMSYSWLVGVREVRGLVERPKS